MVLIALGVPVILAVLPVLVWIGTAVFSGVAVRTIVAWGSRNRRRRIVSVSIAVPVAGIGQGG
jgi:hypothetical protein